MEVSIISKEHIKPSTPTPPYKRSHQLSVLDQLNSHSYIPYLFFYLSKDSGTGDEIDTHSRRLKRAMSETLTRFYPLAGELKENHLEVDCNDNGVYFVVAKVSFQLLDLLEEPETKLIHQLLPYNPSSKELQAKRCAAMVQVNFFSCGGVVIALNTSHKVIDGYSATLFWKSWAAAAAAARGGSCRDHQECPDFNIQRIFPPNHSLPKDASLVMWPTLMGKCRCLSRRFVFDSSAIAELKAATTVAATPHGRSNVEVGKKTSRVATVIGFIWKCIMAASRVRSGSQRPSILTVSVNLRAKASPPLPYAMGNMIWFAIARYKPSSTQNNNLELSSVVECLQEAILEVDESFVEELKGEEGSRNIGKHLERLRSAYSHGNPGGGGGGGDVAEEADYVVASSLCNAGLYDIDFGWDRPAWLCHGGVDADCPALTNLIVLADTKSGGGIEATVSLDEQLMRIMEKDQELLSFASINPRFLERNTLVRNIVF